MGFAGNPTVTKSVSNNQYLTCLLVAPMGVGVLESSMTRRFLGLIAFAAGVLGVSLMVSLTPRADAAEDRSTLPASRTTYSVLLPTDDPPDVLGLTLEQAIDRIKAAELGGRPPYVVGNEAPSTVDENAVVVVKQVAFGGSLPDKVGPTVGLLLGVRMPDVVGQTLPVARNALRQLALVPGVTPPEARESWTVVKQTPAAGELLPFGYQVLVVLRPTPTPQKVKVPDLVGHTEDEAEVLVGAAELVYTPQVIKDGDRPGQVVSQQPRPKEFVDVGSPVSVDIVRTTAPKPVVVPDVVRKDESKARAAIEAVKLVFDPRIVKEGSGLGRVVRQSPQGGHKVLPGTAVTVDIERTEGPRPKRTFVPDVLGQKEPTAREAIQTAQLKFRSRVVRPGTGVGIVLTQRPLPGIEVELGSIVTVDLTREQSPKLVAVPDLVDRNEEEARDFVERVQLIFDLMGGKDSAGRSRHVVRQVPPAGSLVPAGTTVTVELAADETNGTPWSLLPLLIAVGLVAGGAAASIERRHARKRSRGLPPHIRAAGRPLTLESIRLQESSPAHRIRVKPHVDRGRQYLQEEKDR
jgi:beta-lactam-binding protein with PASTA domain